MNNVRKQLRIVLAASLLAAIATLAGCGHEGPPNAADQIGTRRGWNVFLAEPCSDTLSFPWREVVSAVEPTFRAEDWHIQRANRERGDFLTAWKPIRHALVRIFMGKIEARCAVSVRPLGSNRTLVVFQGGIASRRDIARSPALQSAKNTYRKACSDWQDKLRAEVLRRRANRAPTT